MRVTPVEPSRPVSWSLAGLGTEELAAVDSDEVGHAGGVEEVLAEEAQGLDGRQGEVTGRREGVELVGAEGVGLDAASRGRVEVERKRLRPEDLGRQGLEGLCGERVAALARVEGRRIVESGEGALGGRGNGRGRGGGGGASVVLDAVAEGDVLEDEALWRRREFAGCETSVLVGVVRRE
jgi:hypothetical protein